MRRLKKDPFASGYVLRVLRLLTKKAGPTLSSGPLRYHGAPRPIRTADTRVRRAVLCPLSYGGVVGIVANYYVALAADALALADDPLEGCGWAFSLNSTYTLTSPVTLLTSK